MLQLVCLVVDGLSNFFIAMAYADRKDSAEEIQKFVTLDVINKIALRMIHDQRFVVVSGNAREKILLLFVDNFLFFHSFFRNRLVS